MKLILILYLQPKKKGRPKKSEDSLISETDSPLTSPKVIELDLIDVKQFFVFIETKWQQKGGFLFKLGFSTGSFQSGRHFAVYKKCKICL